MTFVGIAFLGQNKGNVNAYIKAGSILGLFLMFCTLFQLIIYGYYDSIKLLYELTSTHKDGGGILGASIVKLLVPAIGIVGTYIVVILICIICFVALSGKSFVGAVKKESEKAYQTAKTMAEEQREKRAIEKANQRLRNKFLSKEKINLFQVFPLIQRSHRNHRMFMRLRHRNLRNHYLGRVSRRILLLSVQLH